MTRWKVAIGASGALLVGGIAAQAQRRPVDLIDTRTIKAQMQFLGGADLKGRNAGSAEGRIAADYIASEFARLGLVPKGDGGGYFQNFDIVRAQVDEANTRLKVSAPGGEKMYLYGPDFNMMWEPQTNSSATVKAPVVFAGYGINAPEYGYNDLAGIDVRGKIVLILPREPQASNPNSRFKGKWDTLYAYPWFKIESLRQAGAAGILIVSELARRPDRIASGQPDYLIFGGVRYPASLTTDRWDLPVFSVSPRLADALLAASNKTVSSLQNSIDQSYKPESFEISSTTVTMSKAFTSEQVLHARNVVAMLEGSDPKLKAETVVVSAHYDHGGVVGTRVYPGADDNASGTVGLLQITQAFCVGNVKPARSMLFIAFDAEERGLLGAFYYIDHPIVPFKQTVANLNMDMIGRDEESPTWKTTPDQNRNDVNLVGTLYNPQLRAIIEQENQSIGLKLDFKTDTDDPEGWFARSDHFGFALKSVPMVLFNTGEHADYHTENDTWDRIDYPKMEKIVRLIFLTAVNVADMKTSIPFVP